MLAQLQLTATDELQEEVYDPGLYAVAVGDWFVVIGDGSDFMDLVGRDQAIALSKHAPAVYFFTDDAPMCAEITSFVAGQPAWTVSYDGSGGVSTPTLEGIVPTAVQSILAEARKEQNAAGPDVDHMYDVAANLGRALVGFRHDETLADAAHLPILQLAGA